MNRERLDRGPDAQRAAVLVEHRTGAPRSTSACAVDRPAIPAPTTATSVPRSSGAFGGGKVLGQRELLGRDAALVLPRGEGLAVAADVLPRAAEREQDEATGTTVDEL